ncbi:MAG TPA: NAD(P)(+) transhydrogenase (Re/Si-specific) subunit beta [Polyangia bacterium]|jgi:NAD(P) transhydrogenase subunit beta|nr:NAD(P)(+) transhydrogenase (Re/Si-specific) subunit beta [Polyangia bacterium]
MIVPVVTIRSVAYLAASLLFILSLRGLSTQESARQGNRFGIIGMLVAVVMTAVALLIPGESAAAAPDTTVVGVLGGALGIGCVIGALLATRVAMTSMPELVAILHSFVGAAAVLVGIATYLQPAGVDAADRSAHLGEIYVGILVGAVTFSGSVIAFGKLRGKIGSKPLLLPGRHILNIIALTLCVALGVIFQRADVAWPDPGMRLTDAGMPALLAMTGIALLLGVHMVMAIGGGDMPVVVSLLNSYSGWAAAAAGFMLSNDLLIITGALVGSSGAILSYIMCKAMNRSILNVILGGFGAESGAKPAAGGAAVPAGKVNETTVDQVAELLLAARSVIIVPGYGMAVAQAQHPVKEISSLLIEKGIKCRYAIHPVAGRLPGHMNVLLAEASVSYDIVKEMDEINEDFPTTDVVMVIGANDIVNPSAEEDPSSPIYGMPVLQVWKAARVVMLKRGMAAGYAGVDNPLVYNDNTLMLFGDAKQSVTKLLTALRAGG